jgi:hypothetical protein
MGVDPERRRHGDEHMATDVNYVHKVAMSGHVRLRPKPVWAARRTVATPVPPRIRVRPQRRLCCAHSGFPQLFRAVQARPTDVISDFDGNGEEDR